MKKTYKSKLDFLGILVPYKGTMVHVNFERAVLSATGLRGCKFETDDKELQKAIEAYPDFGVNRIDGIWTDDVEEPVDTDPVEDNDMEKPQEEVKVSLRRSRKAK